MRQTSPFASIDALHHSRISDIIDFMLEGKGTEDRRGLLITEAAAEKCWLYSYPLIGNRHIEVAAMVLNINPAINASYDSVEMATLQQVCCSFPNCKF